MKPEKNPINVEDIIFPLEKKRWNIKQTEKSIIRMVHSKISKLLNNSTVSNEWTGITNQQGKMINLI